MLSVVAVLCLVPALQTSPAGSLGRPGSRRLFNRNMTPERISIHDLSSFFFPSSRLLPCFPSCLSSCPAPDP